MIRTLSPTNKEALALYELLVVMHDDAKLNFPPIDPQKFMDSLGHCYNVGKIFVADRESKIVGAIGLKPERFWWSNYGFLADMFFFVHPDYRKGRVAIQLLDEAKKYAYEREMPLIISVLNGMDVERKSKFLERKGFNQVGGSFALGL